LLIDHSAVILRMIVAVLEHAGFEVKTSTSVAQVITALGDWRPDVILTDVNMPGTSGVELCRQLKATYETAHVPVVLFSALSGPELEILARTCEADGFLSKSDLASLPRELSLLLDTSADC
jgi:CheY-like chemotaxis protein